MATTVVALVALAAAQVEGHATPTVDAALHGFQKRRWERCRMVVENSARLGEIEVTGGDKAEHMRIMRDSFASLTTPM